MFDVWRSGRFRTYPKLPDWPGLGLVAAPRAGLACSRGQSRSPRSSRRSGRRATTMLSRRPRGARRRSLVRRRATTAFVSGAAVGGRAASVSSAILEWEPPSDPSLPLSRHTPIACTPTSGNATRRTSYPYWEPAVGVAVACTTACSRTPPRGSSRQGCGRRQRLARSYPVQAARQPEAELGANTFRSVHTTGFLQLLTETSRRRCSVSTYQSGRIIVVRADGSAALNTHFRSLPRARWGWLIFREGRSRSARGPTVRGTSTTSLR